MQRDVIESITYCVHSSSLRELSPKRGFHFRDGIYPQTIEPECLQRCSPLQERRTDIFVVLIEILLLVRIKLFKLGYA